MAQESHENRYLRILDDDSIQYIHHSALRILSEIGVRIHDRAAVKAVSKAGADGDEDKGVEGISQEVPEPSDPVVESQLGELRLITHPLEHLDIEELVEEFGLHVALDPLHLL